MPWMLVEVSQTKGNRVFARGLCQLIEHDLLRDRHVGVAHRAPPQYRQRALRLTPRDMHVRDVVLLGSVTLDRGRIQAILHRSGERRTGHDRLSDDTLPIGYDLTILTKSRCDAVIVHGAVAATGNVIFSSQAQAHGT